MALTTSPSPEFNLTWCYTLKNVFILLIFGALFLSSSTVAVLEPCLPAWLVQNIKIEVRAMRVRCLYFLIQLRRYQFQKWQAAFIFLPDSFGYLIGTSAFGTLSHRYGKWKTTTLALLLIGISMIMVSWRVRESRIVRTIWRLWRLRGHTSANKNFIVQFYRVWKFP